MAQISAQITQILPAFNRRATSFSLAGQREAICDICGFRDFAAALGLVFARNAPAALRHPAPGS